MERVVVLSDVHLGSDLNHVLESVRRSRGVEEDLVKLLTHYRTSTPVGARIAIDDGASTYINLGSWAEC